MPPGYVNVGYFPNWAIYQKAYKPENVPFAHLTHILYAFAKVDDATGAVQLSDAWADQQIRYEGDAEASASHLCGNLYQFFQYKKTHRHLKLLLSIGGWSFSGAFRALIDPAKRERFIDTAVRLLADHGFDGLDVDWEYPKTRDEAKAYVALLAGLRHALDAYGKNTTPNQPHYLLTIAAPCAPTQYRLLDIKSMDPYLDFWNLMAYDFSGSWDSVANHQANLYGGDVSVSRAVKDYQKAGVPANKLVVGVPLYGRGFDGTTGAGQPYARVSPGSAEGGVYMYKELPRSNAKEDYSGRSGAAWSFDGQQWISYDTPVAVSAKAQFIKKQGLRGAMFWELSGDVPAEQERSLVRCMAQSVRIMD